MPKYVNYLVVNILNVESSFRHWNLGDITSSSGFEGYSHVIQARMIMQSSPLFWAVKRPANSSWPYSRSSLICGEKMDVPNPWHFEDFFFSFSTTLGPWFLHCGISELSRISPSPAGCSQALSGAQTGKSMFPSWRKPLQSSLGATRHVLFMRGSGVQLPVFYIEAFQKWDAYPTFWGL